MEMLNTISIDDLPLAEYLSEDDEVPINQNLVTKKVKFENIQHSITTTIQKANVGIIHMLDFNPTPLWLAKNRYLVLNYQIIEIALYQELCDLKWVGPELNATALFWYKCNANGDRNPNGLYMRVSDWRGIFPRGAGANAVLRTDMANPLSPPYDGDVVGGFLNDAFQGHRFSIYNYNPTCTEYSPYYMVLLGDDSRGFCDNIYTTSPCELPGYGVPRIAYETRSVSMSVIFVISY